MKMSTIRPNFSAMPEDSQRQFFLTYAENRVNDFKIYSMAVVKTKSSSKKEPKMTLTKEQLAMLKILNLV